MAERQRPVKVGVWRGGGPPPGYEWTVLMLKLALDEADQFFDGDQYEYIACQVKELAKHHNPTISDCLSLDRVETFLELREKGGPLGTGVNVRVYYDIVHEPRVIRILGVDVKKNEGRISMPVKERIKRRQRKWNDGEYPMLSVVVAESPAVPQQKEKGRE